MNTIRTAFSLLFLLLLAPSAFCADPVSTSQGKDHWSGSIWIRQSPRWWQPPGNYVGYFLVLGGETGTQPPVTYSQFCFYFEPCLCGPQLVQMAGHIDDWTIDFYAAPTQFNPTGYIGTDGVNTQALGYGYEDVFYNSYILAINRHQIGATLPPDSGPFAFGVRLYEWLHWCDMADYDPQLPLAGQNPLPDTAPASCPDGGCHGGK